MSTSPLSPPLRIVYMGTPEFAVPSLQALIDSQHEVVGVFTNPDRPSGRGKKLTPSPVKALATQHGIPVYQPQRVRKNPEALETLRGFAPDLVVVAAYGCKKPVLLIRREAHGADCTTVEAFQNGLCGGFGGVGDYHSCLFAFLAGGHQPPISTRGHA